MPHIGFQSPAAGISVYERDVESIALPAQFLGDVSNYSTGLSEINR